LTCRDFRLSQGYGLLESALARPQTNKRLALAAAIAFLGMNGFRLTDSNDQAYELIMAVASGSLDDVPAIGEQLAAHIEQSDVSR
jgi:prophage maintenance system killer protein